MTKTKIDKNSVVYCDANFLIAIAQGGHDEQPGTKGARILFAKLLISECKIIVSPLTFDETWLGIKKETEKELSDTISGIKGFLESKFKFKFSKNVQISYYKIVDKLDLFTKKLLQHKNFSVVQFEDPKRGIRDALNNIRNFKLKPRDSFHLAYMQNNSASHLVSADKHFRNENLGVEVVDFRDF